MIKLAVFDLDGTLAPHGGAIPFSVADKLRTLQKSGVLFAVCSGKPVYYLSALLRQACLSPDALVGENGAVIQIGSLLPPEKQISLRVPEKSKELLFALRREISDMYGDMVWYQPNEIVLTVFPKDASLFPPLRSLIEKRIAPDSGINVFKHLDCFDLVPGALDKGAGLRALAEFFGIDRKNICSVGDESNDFPMFAASGVSLGINLSADKADFIFPSCGMALDWIIGKTAEQ